METKLGTVAGADELLEKAAVGGILVARALLHLEHEVRPGEGDGHAVDDDLGDAEPVQFAGERDEIGVGGDAGHFPLRCRFAIHESQASLLTNLKPPLGWPRPRATRAAVRWSRAKRCRGVARNWPRTLIAGVSTPGR